MNKKMDIYEKLVLIVGLILALGLVVITALGVVKKVKNKDTTVNNRKVTINQRMKEDEEENIKGPAINNELDKAIFVANFITDAEPYLSNEEDENGYRKVLYERFQSFNDLNMYLSSVYSPDLVNEYVKGYRDNNLFMEKEDGLYSKAYSREISVYDYKYTSVQDESKSIFLITVDYEDEENGCHDQYAVDYELNEDGNINFTSMKTPYEVCNAK